MAQTYDKRENKRATSVEIALFKETLEKNMDDIGANLHKLNDSDRKFAESVVRFYDETETATYRQLEYLVPMWQYLNSL